ncbi:MAG TPA: PhoU domain-containing protein [Nitrososphaerales archaeon]|nr:PhoU domain-containing protein [Nitrososphaerales archaeon]
MEVRKVQSTKLGTFLVTIPKEWVSQMGLAKGGHVSLELEGTDVVVSSVNKRPSTQSRPLDIDKVKDRKMLELSIGSSYIQGHDITEVVSSGKILPEQKRWIREAVHNLVGVEVAEEYSNRVVLQNLVDPRMFDLDQTMKKFSDSSVAVLRDAMGGLSTGDKVLAQDAFERGYQSTKLYRLLLRLSLQFLRNRKLRDEMKVYAVDDIVMRMLAIKDLGRTAYYSYRTAQHATEIEERVDPSAIRAVKKMAATTAAMQEQAFDGFIKQDVRTASSVIDQMDEVRRLFKDLHGMSTIGGMVGSLPFTLIVRDIRGIAGYAVALADDAVLASFG